MSKHSRVTTAFLAGLVGMVAVAGLASLALAADADHRSVDGTIWVANRGAHTIRGFDPATGESGPADTVVMRDGSQPGDLAYAKGKLYVAEEFPQVPAVETPTIAIVELETRLVTKRIDMAVGSRPHHVHASADGKLVAFGLFGTDMVAVVETRTDTLLGTWDTNPAPGATSGRAHAGVFSPNGKTLYVASDASNEVIALDPRTGDVFWRLNVPGAHELAVTRNGKTAYVSRRTANQVCVLDLRRHETCTDVLSLGLPDTLRLARGDKLLTIGLRQTGVGARVAVVDTRTFDFELVRIGPLLELNTLAGHQWTSRDGRYTFAAYEGGSNPGVAVIDHRAGNTVVQTFSYPVTTGISRPHGVDLEPEPDDDDDDDDEDEDDDDEDEDD